MKGLTIRRYSPTGIVIVPEGRCPKCTSKRILGPRVVKNDEEWCNCYGCGHEWQTNKTSTKRVMLPKLKRDGTAKPKLKWVAP